VISCRQCEGVLAICCVLSTRVLALTYLKRGVYLTDKTVNKDVLVVLTRYTNQLSKPCHVRTDNLCN
jgi:hypothetical protein